MSERSGSLFQKVLINGDYSPRFFAYYYKQWNNYKMQFHHHNSTEIMYLISGSCTVDVRQMKGNAESYSMKRGELIILDANVPHRLIVEDGTPCRMLNVEFGFTEYKGVAPSIGSLAREEQVVARLLGTPFSSLILPDPEEVYHVLKSLVLELDQRGADGGSMTDLLFCEMLLRIARLKEEKLRSSQHPTEFYVRRSIEFLHQNYDRSIQVKDIALAVSLHPGYLHRIFKSHTGRTITDYLNILRIEKSRMLLAKSDIPVAEIADYVGISSRQYFHLLFKKYTGLTPVEYRNSIERHSWIYEEGESGNLGEDI
ncbi:AraC family transcriptional regulator [Paenibacillus wynnii]|uniref:AraC family transcriptional regulator n=1 Tax=Paenibacillus wynnii TaxID=268407 RepID=UPI00278EEE72|nr:AraC family transcriptional regulator [Paenibacillus wynnii]MDQ0191868.1 AraC-like DNA-binding protein/mannose-6-phosphate isomerase-like protein (cupin superfamily) [Paenibacillus wynnii]